MIVDILGYRARVCNRGCASGFREDRRYGLIYGPHAVNGVLCMSREEWSLASRHCAYCGEWVGGRVPPKTKAKFGIE